MVLKLVSKDGIITSIGSYAMKIKKTASGHTLQISKKSGFVLAKKMAGTKPHPPLTIMQNNMTVAIKFRKGFLWNKPKRAKQNLLGRLRSVRVNLDSKQ